MTNYISDDLASILREQVKNEVTNSLLYWYIGGNLRNRGLNNIAKFFDEDQRLEETTHALLFYKLLTDLNTPFDFQEIDAINFPIDKISDISEKFIEREIGTTESIEEILALAEKEGNSIVVEFCRMMLAKQQGEMEEAYDFSDKAGLCSDDWWKVMLWDANFE